MVFKIIPGAVFRPDLGGDCVMEVGDRDFGMEDADGDIVQGVFSFGTGSGLWDRLGMMVLGLRFHRRCSMSGMRPDRFEQVFKGIGAVWVVPWKNDYVISEISD